MHDNVGHPDSVEKLCVRLSTVARHPVIYNGKPLTPQLPKEIHVDKSFFRSFTCPSGCTACCLRFTLDYYVGETDHTGNPEFYKEFSPRFVDVNGMTSQIWTHYPNKEETHVCDFLHPSTQRIKECALFPMPPIECKAAPQIRMSLHSNGISHISGQPFGRAWAFKQRPQCYFGHDIGPVELKDKLDLLRRYEGWADYLGIETYLENIIWAIKNEQGPCVVHI